VSLLCLSANPGTSRLANALGQCPLQQAVSSPFPSHDPARYPVRQDDGIQRDHEHVLDGCHGIVSFYGSCIRLVFTYFTADLLARRTFFIFLPCACYPLHPVPTLHSWSSPPSYIISGISGTLAGTWFH
jgi:hypothetical protein